jgi:anti-sigma factor RsiW
MNCTDASRELLTADPAELAGRVPTALSRHIQSCARCGGAAAAILARTDLLRRTMDSSTPCRAPTAAVARAERRQRRRRRWLVAGPVLVAAGLAGLLLTSDALDRGIEIDPVAREVQVMRPLVEQPRDVDVAVFTTDNPNIVVVWFF